MKNLIAFAGSNSKNSINKKLVEYAASLVPDVNVELLDLNDYEMPIYSIDKENESGIPQLAIDFENKIRSCDGLDDFICRTQWCIYRCFQKISLIDF